MSNYQLTIDDLDTSIEGDTPTIRAARNPIPSVLEALLAHYASESARNAQQPLPRREFKSLQQCSPDASVCGAITGAYESPLTAAIRANLPANLSALLAAGADPNGISLDDQADYSVRFIRGRNLKDDTSSFALCAPRSEVLEAAAARGIPHPIAPLTEGELEERRNGFPRFWTEPNVPGQRLRMTPARTALEVASQCGHKEIIELLRAAGADESSWLADSPSLLSPDDELLLPDRPKPSVLSTSSPVHEAVAAGHHSILRHLLTTCNHSPNHLPIAAPTVALPPLSYAIARCHLTNPGVQSCITELLAHPHLDPHVRTPIFDVHILHFATARHDAALLSWLAASVPGGFSAAGTTALGHTLLHIAALPLNSNQTVARNPVVARSVHCARTLDSTWTPHALPSPLHARFAAPEDLGGKDPRPMARAEQETQKATIKVLLEWGGLDVRVTDVDGNTALHYLAATLNQDDKTVELVRGMERGEETWRSARNMYGVTPEEMWGD